MPWWHPTTNQPTQAAVPRCHAAGPPTRHRASVIPAYATRFGVVICSQKCRSTAFPLPETHSLAPFPASAIPAYERRFRVKTPVLRGPFSWRAGRPLGPDHTPGSIQIVVALDAASGRRSGGPGAPRSASGGIQPLPGSSRWRLLRSIRAALPEPAALTRWVPDGRRHYLGDERCTVERREAIRARCDGCPDRPGGALHLLQEDLVRSDAPLAQFVGAKRYAEQGHQVLASAVLPAPVGNGTRRCTGLSYFLGLQAVRCL